MSIFDSPEANAAYNGLQGLIEGIGKGLHDVGEGAQALIDAAVHDAAVRLMNALLPPMVHGKNVVIKSGGWIAAEAITAEILWTLNSASVSNGVLSGLVAKKVEEGVGHITSRLEYTHGVGSIT